MVIKPDKHSEFFSDNDISDLIDRLQRQSYMNDFERVIMNPVDTGKLRESITDRDKPYSRNMPFGIEITYSPYVEQGTALLVEKRNVSFPPLDIPDSFDYGAFQKKLTNQIASAFGVPYRYFQPQTERPYHWQRFPDESVLEWGDRLFARGLLDNPDIRWQYQKAVWATLFAPLKTVWIRIKKAID